MGELGEQMLRDAGYECPECWALVDTKGRCQVCGYEWNNPDTSGGEK